MGFTQEAGPRRGPRHQEIPVLARQNEPRAHFDITRHDRLVINPRHAREFIVLFTSRDHFPIGIGDPAVAEIAVNAHFRAEIVGPDQQHVHARHRRDFVGVGDRRGGFQHDHRQIGRVQRLRGIAHAGVPQPVMRPDPAHGAVAGRRIFQLFDDFPRLGRGIDMRHHDPHGAVVQGSCGDRILSIRHPRDRRDPRVQRRHADLRAGIQRHRAVFHVQEQPVEPGGGHRGRDFHAARHAHADTQRQLPGFKLLASDVTNDHIVVSLCESIDSGGNHPVQRRQIHRMIGFIGYGDR